MEDDRPRIGRGDGIDQIECAALGSADRAGNDGIESELDVGGSEQLAIREMHAVAKMKNVSLCVGHAPGFGEVGSQVEVVVALQEAVEEKIVNVFGERVGANARIEIRRHGFEKEVDCVRVVVGTRGRAAVQESQA